MLLYGINSVFERLKREPQSINKIFMDEDFSMSEIEALITVKKIPAEKVSTARLFKLKGADNLQGIVAQVKDFNYTPFDNFLMADCAKKPNLVFLDRIYDPQNLGSIIRTSACFGGFGLVIPKYKACQVNETVLHVASGGENYIRIALVSNLSTAIIAAKQNGYWIVGAVVNAAREEIGRAPFPFPLGVVLGSEGQGVRHGISKHLDINVSIPMKGANLSFNVATACAIFCYEISKQRGEFIK